MCRGGRHSGPMGMPTESVSSLFGQHEDSTGQTMMQSEARTISTTSPSEQKCVINRVTWIGLVINLALTGLKAVFGIIGGSQALVADAVHSLSDMVTDVAVVAGAPFWTAPADEDHPYGHGRIETMVTVFIGAALAVVGVMLAVQAVSTIASADSRTPGWTPFCVAVMSIVSKEWLYRWTVKAGRRIRSSAVIANAWHHRSDAMSSIPVAVAVAGVHIRPDWQYLDHIGAIIVSIMILQAALSIVWPALRQLTDAGASEKVQTALRAVAVQTPGVRAIHALRTRQLGPGLYVDLHVLVDPELTVRDGHDIAREVRKQLMRQGDDVVDVLVHVEPYDEEHLAGRADNVISP